MTNQEYMDYLFKTYELIHLFSNKNDCRVLHVRHQELKKDLVIHILPKPLLAYEMLCDVQCDNLPVIYDVIYTDDGMIVLEEYIDGMTLAESMVVSQYDYRKAKHIIYAVCNACSVLHGKGLVHRDIKPENILIDQNNRIVLIDFNISRQITESNCDTVIMGTLGYAAPEQMGITQSVTHTDIYAIGVLLNVILTGKHPCEKLASGRAKHIIGKCTHINPRQRYPDVHKLVGSL